MVAPASPQLPQLPRKRTSSFSSPSTDDAIPRSAKVPRLDTLTSSMGSLRRSETLVWAPESQAASASSNATAAGAASSRILVASSTSSSAAGPSNTHGVPYKQSMQHYKEQRQREKARIIMMRASDPVQSRTPIPRPPVDLSNPQCYGPPQIIFPDPYAVAPAPRARVRPPRPQLRPRASVSPVPAPPRPPRAPTPPVKQSQPPLPYRLSSPLCPEQVPIPLPPHLLTPFPNSKHEPNLYKIALIKKVRRLPEGPQILRMGPRAYGVVRDATLDLERLVNSSQRRERDRVQEEDRDVVMADGTMTMTSSTKLARTSTWLVEDFEMDITA